MGITCIVRVELVVLGEVIIWEEFSHLRSYDIMASIVTVLNCNVFCHKDQDGQCDPEEERPCRSKYWKNISPRL